MVDWIRKNIGWIGPTAFLIAAIAVWSSGIFGFFVEIEARPVAQEVAEEEVVIHELRMEPRWVAIEIKQEALVQQNEEALKILRKLDPDANSD
jgi:EAL domain-containing protein (putative c-di-GMP-specific phosphodiesterase class I)